MVCDRIARVRASGASVRLVHADGFSVEGGRDGQAIDELDLGALAGRCGAAKRLIIGLTLLAAALPSSPSTWSTPRYKSEARV